ncbi:hypothetical protein E3P91_03380 [Wallemia ichthyophaga]|nr:hypothetical protein E3P91_03380 [Wallemia ichthyophaga]
MEDEKLISKLWKVSRTSHELVQDRGFAVSQEEIEVPYADFKGQYAGNGMIDRNSLHFFASLEDNPDDQIFVYFADEPSIGIKTMRKFLTVLEERKIGRGILIYPEKLTPAANKVIAEMAADYKLQAFTESELQVNITHHQLVPQHEVLTAEEKKLLLQKYRLKPTQLPRILTSDPVARYFGLERGQVVKIIRPSETSGRYASYRICFYELKRYIASAIYELSIEAGASEVMDVDADVNSDSESDAVQDSDHYSHENIPSPAESSHDEFEEVAPKKKPRKSAMKGAGAALKRKKNVQIRKDHDSDNFLYETLTEATVDLPTAVQDWLAMYVDSRREALRILINCLIKSTGCQHTITSDQVVDFDSIPDVVDSLERSFKTQSNTAYPLIHRVGTLKKIGGSISKLLEDLVSAASESSALYDVSEESETLMETSQQWITSLSSSPLRAFRHTATVWGLSLSSALCKLAKDFDKQFSKETRRRQSSNKSDSLLSRKTTVENYIQEITDGLFIHRYRDVEPIIRSECVKALGSWMKTWPNHFLEGNYLRYTGWLLSDTDSSVRHAAIESLISLYGSDDHLTPLQHFTDRFKQRLLEICLKDVDAPVRISALKLMTAIDGHELLEDNERIQVSKLAFDINPKIRKTCGDFWQRLVEDEQQRLRGTLGDDDDDTEKEDIDQLTMIKAFTSLLVTSTRSIDGNSSVNDGNEVGSRLRIALDDLWSSLQVARDWKAMLSTLIMDHSSSDDDLAQFKLKEDEENVLVELFCACVSHIHAEANPSTESTGRKKKKIVDDTDYTSVSRQLMQDLPSLFSKHQAIPSRIADLLSLPRYMQLTLYLDMRMESEFESLYNEICQQLQKHSLPSVLEAATDSIFALNDAGVFVHISERNLNALVYNLTLALKTLVAGQEIEDVDIDQESVSRLESALLRLVYVVTRSNISDTLNESSAESANACQIVQALASRGALGYEIESKMVENALQLLFLDLLWTVSELVKLQPTTTDNEDSEYEFKKMQVKTLRDNLYHLAIDLSVGSTSNSTDSVKSKGFKILMEIVILFADNRPKELSTEVSKHTSMEFSEETQLRCMGYVESEIDKFAEEIHVNADNDDDEAAEEIQNDKQSSDEDEAPKIKKRKSKTTPKKQAPKQNKQKKQELTLALQPDRINYTYEFSETIAVVVKAIRLGVLSIDKLPVILAHHGRFGVLFDSLNKLALDAIREIALYAGSEYYLGIVHVVTTSLISAHELLLEGKVEDESRLLTLGRSLSSSLVLRGAQLKIVSRASSNVVVAIHKRVISELFDDLKPLVNEQRKNSTKISQINSGFKALQHLLAVGPSSLIEGRHALEVKNFYDEQLKAAEIELSTSSKIWEGARSYEKKLVTLIAKDKVLVKHRNAQEKDVHSRASREKHPRAAATAGEGLSKDMVGSEDEGEEGSEDGGEDEVEDEEQNAEIDEHNENDEHDEKQLPDEPTADIQRDSSPLSSLTSHHDENENENASQTSKKRSRQSDAPSPSKGLQMSNTLRTKRSRID